MWGNFIGTLKNLKTTDPEIYKAIKNELKRQRDSLEMIASENCASVNVLNALGTVLSNKYSEGYPKKRYYAGNEFIDVIETVAIERAKGLFKCRTQTCSRCLARLRILQFMLRYANQEIR